MNYYRDKYHIRQKELDWCLSTNINNISLNNIIILVSGEDYPYLDKKLRELSAANISIRIVNKEPTYNDYFNITKGYPNDINIISNSDIVFCEESLNRLRVWDWDRKCLALSRWDYTSHDKKLEESIHFKRSDSQDVWMVKGSFPQIDAANFCLGLAGCDNRIAFLLKDHYKITNPSIDIKVYHYHLSDIRRSTAQGKERTSRVPPPYQQIHPTKLVG